MDRIEISIAAAVVEGRRTQTHWELGAYGRSGPLPSSSVPTKPTVTRDATSEQYGAASVGVYVGDPVVGVPVVGTSVACPGRSRRCIDTGELDNECGPDGTCDGIVKGGSSRVECQQVCLPGLYRVAPTQSGKALSPDSTFDAKASSISRCILTAELGVRNLLRRSN